MGFARIIKRTDIGINEVSNFVGRYLLQMERVQVQLSGVRFGPVDGEDVAEVARYGPPHPGNKKRISSDRCARRDRLLVISRFTYGLC